MATRTDKNGTVWEVDAQGNPVRPVSAAPQAITLSQGDPYAQPKAQADAIKAQNAAAASNLDPAISSTQLQNAQYQQPNAVFNQKDKLRSDYNAMPAVKAYRVAIQQLAQALDTGAGAQSDLALTYAFAKAMDPESVVRDSEQGMVSSSQPWFQATVEQAKKQFGMDGAGIFTPEARKKLREQIIKSVKTRVGGYEQIRNQFADIAQRSNFDPAEIVGKHDAAPFVEQFKKYDEQLKKTEGGSELPEGVDQKDVKALIKDASGKTVGYEPTDGGPDVMLLDGGGYDNSYLGQGLSGINEGIANTLGAPVDLTTAALNLVPRGINAIANTNIPTIENPVFGSQQIKGWMGDAGMTFAGSDDPAKQFTRRVGQSVGGAAIPMGSGMTLGRVGQQMLIGGGGGVGAATAQQVFPGNPWAELGGELLGGGASAGGLLGSLKRNATRDIEAAVPTVPQLKEQASDLYRQAETRGVTASPSQTQELRDNIEQTLRNEGQLGPAGRISDADTSTTKAFNLIGQYAGQPMRPNEMNTVRGVIAEGRKSMEPADQRMASVLTEQFDDWARPMAPEFDQARDVSSRYLQAQDLEEARRLAEASASQFSASGLENALRTQYRGLDKKDITGRSNFAPDVSEAIQKVGRGTPLSNFARNVGRFAPTGPVSFAASVGLPALGGNAVAGPIGGALGATVGLGGMGGRLAANAMTDRAATIAELTARNGGRLPEANVLTPEVLQMLAATTAAETAKYVPPKPKKRGIFGSKR